jgi:hypothetical protein
MQTGGTYPVTLTPGFSNKARFEYWRVWIDINGDFDFEDPNEEVFAANNIKTAVTGNLTLPENATPGLTRMRVSMKNTAAPLPCENFARGEVEDYTVNIQPPGTRLLAGNDENITVQPDFTLYPNPASDKLTLLISGWETATTVKVYDITGLLIRHFEAFNGIRDINISSMNPGIYLFIVSDGMTLKTRKLVIK